ALGNLAVVFRRVVRGPAARRWAILQWCFAGLYAGLRPGAGQSCSGVSPGCTRACGPALGNLAVVFRRVVRATED
ncbi:MAG: hypothetical protein WAN54_16210, partial [Syntrophobacteraceae bacterium]